MTAKVFHRMRGVYLAVVLIVTASVVGLLVQGRGGLLVCISVVGLATCYAVVDYFGQRLEVTEHTIRDRRLIGPASTELDKDQVMQCSYRRVVLGRPPYFFCAVLSDADDRTQIAIRRYGWGSKRRALFAEIRQWLATSAAHVDEETRRFLESAGAD